MSIVDKLVAAVTPPESEEARIEARSRARSLAVPGEWFSIILDHHEQLEAAFAGVKKPETAETRRAAQKLLGILLTGHANAEETVIYPAMSANGEAGDATMAYAEQAAAKTQMAMLDMIDPMSQDYLDKLEHIRGAVAHHMYEEEGTWFARLKQSALQGDQTLLTKRYIEEFERYVGNDLGGRVADPATDALTMPYQGVNASMADTATTMPGDRA